MPEPGVIQAYLDKLRAALRVGRRYRDRVVAEIEDHLIESAVHHHAAGADASESERMAIAGFGEIAQLAAAYHRRAAARAMRATLVVALAAATLEAAAQTFGSPLFWHVAGGGVRAAGPWPYPVKDGLILAADLRALADVVTVVGLAIGVAAWGGTRRWVPALCGPVALASIGVAALAGLAELGGADGFGPSGAQLTAVIGLLVVAGGLSAASAAGTAWRLWRVRGGWLPARGPVVDLRAAWARMSPPARRALSRGSLVLIPAALVVTVIAGAFEFTHQQDLRSDANHPQLDVATTSARALAAGADPASVAAGSKVDLAHSLGVHITVFDASGRVLASTAVLAGHTPIPPRGVLRFAARRSDVLTWQPDPKTRVALVAVPWSGPAGHGTIGVGRSLRVVEQRESRLVRRVAWWWLVAMLTSLLAALGAAWGPPRPPGQTRRAAVVAA